MPLYHYLCNSCNKQFEIRHKYREAGIICTHCDSEEIKKHLGNTISVVKQTKHSKTKKVGTEVHEAIQDGKEDLAKAKKELAGKARKTHG